MNLTALFCIFLNESQNNTQRGDENLEKERLIETVNRACQGDENAKEALYLDTYKSVYGFALQLMKKNQEDAEDITQEVFITVNEKISELREPAAFYKWVEQITRNKCYELFRKYKGIVFLDDEDAFLSIVDDDPLNLPDKAIDDEATRKIIIDVIDALPDGQRVCILYYYYSQLTIAQIADILEISEGTVKSRLSAARAKIRAALEEKEKKEGIKLYGIPLALAPILRQAIEQTPVPDGLSARIWENVIKAVSSNALPDNGSGGASEPSMPKLGAGGTAGLAKKAVAALGAKGIAAVVGGTVLVVAVAVTAVFWPQISEMFSPGEDLPSIIMESPQEEITDEADSIDDPQIIDESQLIDDPHDIITVGSWVDQATGDEYTFYDDNTVTATRDGRTESGTYEIYAGSIGLAFTGETRVMRFELDGDDLLLVYQGMHMNLSRTSHSDAQAESAEIPPGKYFNSSPMFSQGDLGFPYIEINSDGTYSSWIAHFDDRSVRNGTYTVSGDVVSFTALTHYNRGIIEPLPAIISDEECNFTLRFDGMNLISVDWRGEMSEIGDVFLLEDDEILWIRLLEAVNDGSNTIIVYDLVDNMNFSKKEFEQLKGGASLDKYGQTFTVRKWDDSEFYSGDMAFAFVTTEHSEYYNELQEVEYSCIMQDGNIVLIDTEYIMLGPMATLQSGLRTTITSETTVHLFYLVSHSDMTFLSPDTRAYEPSILEDSESWYSSLDEFFVTVKDGVWTDMRQVFYS